MCIIGVIFVGNHIKTEIRMTTELSTYLYIGTTLIAAIIYFLTFRYQATKIDLLQKAINSQSSLISDFEKFKKLLDVDDYKKNRDLQLENQKIVLTRFFEVEAKKLALEIANTSGQHFLEINNKVLAAFNELAQIPLSIIMKQYPDKSKKQERDKYIREKFPQSAEFFIGFCDFNNDSRDYLNKSKQ